MQTLSELVLEISALKKPYKMAAVHELSADPTEVGQ